MSSSAAPDETDSPAAARRRRLEVRKAKILQAGGPVTERKKLVVGILSRSRSSSSSPTYPNPNFNLSNNFRAKSTLENDSLGGPLHPSSWRKFRRSSFSEQKKKRRDAKRQSSSSSSGSERENSVNDDVTSESTSDATSSEEEEADVDAVVDVATNLLKLEKQLLQQGGEGGAEGGSANAVDGAANVTAVHRPKPPRVIPTSNCLSRFVKSVPTTYPSLDTCPPHGVLSICGRRREMEDSVSLIPSFTCVDCTDLLGCSCGKHLEREREMAGEELRCLLHLFAVFDGHGGSPAAIFLADNLSDSLARDLSANVASLKAARLQEAGLSSSPSLAHPLTFSQEEREHVWRESMTSTFLRMDAEISGHCYPGRSACNMSGQCAHTPLAAETVGSTAILCCVTPHEIITANCGDSRAVLCRDGKAVGLSKDHKPEREDEIKRIEAAGGRVIFWNGYRVLGVLAMSRAIGDRYLKPYVIADPEVTFTPRTRGKDECMVLASDGLWDVISNEVACDIARKCLRKENSEEEAGAVEAGAQQGAEETPAAVAAAVLTKLALAKGSGDNISVVVVDLREGENAA